MASLGKSELNNRLNRIRSGFVSQGTLLAAWCRDNEINRGNVYKALLQEWRGEKADGVIERVIKSAALSARGQCAQGDHRLEGDEVPRGLIGRDRTGNGRLQSGPPVTISAAGHLRTASGGAG